MRNVVVFPAPFTPSSPKHCRDDRDGAGEAQPLPLHLRSPRSSPSGTQRGPGPASAPVVPSRSCELLRWAAVGKVEPWDGHWGSGEERHCSLTGCGFAFGFRARAGILRRSQVWGQEASTCLLARGRSLMQKSCQVRWQQGQRLAHSQRPVKRLAMYSNTQPCTEVLTRSRWAVPGTQKMR